MQVKKYLAPTLGLLLVAALISGGWWLGLANEAMPVDTHVQATATTAPVSASPISQNALPIRATQFVPAATATPYPTTTPMQLAQSTQRPTRVARNVFVRCDNPYIWSLPVNDAQFQINTQFGIQPVGSVYYDGLVALKLITPLPTLIPSPTVLATETPDLADLTPTISATATITPGIFHPGLDLHTGEDAPIYAVANGTISLVSYNDVYGLYAILQVPGYQVLYGHLNEAFIEEGQQVNCGQRIGLSGATGVYQTGPHLHFEVRQNGVAIDPWPMLKRVARARLPNDLKAQMQAPIPAGKTK